MAGVSRCSANGMQVKMNPSACLFSTSRHGMGQERFPEHGTSPYPQLQEAAARVGGPARSRPRSDGHGGGGQAGGVLLSRRYRSVFGLPHTVRTGAMPCLSPSSSSLLCTIPTTPVEASKMQLCPKEVGGRGACWVSLQANGFRTARQAGHLAAGAAGPAPLGSRREAQSRGSHSASLSLCDPDSTDRLTLCRL